MQQAKGRIAPPKCLSHVATQIEKDHYTLIEQSPHLAFLKLAFTNIIQVCDVTVK